MTKYAIIKDGNEGSRTIIGSVDEYQPQNGESLEIYDNRDDFEAALNS